LATFKTTVAKFANAPIDDLAAQIAGGELRGQVGKIVQVDEIAEAHRVMEETARAGKSSFFLDRLACRKGT
jgi:hypothetical protein